MAVTSVEVEKGWWRRHRPLGEECVSEYHVLDEAGVRRWLSGSAALADRLGGEPPDWRIRDVADGNLNSVFLVDGPAGSLCVKQSLPYVRVAGDDWPLDVDRAAFEAAYIERAAPFVGSLAPELHIFDPVLRVLAMEKLAPHVILRGAFVEGRHFPRVATDIAEYVAQTSVHTSDLAAPFEARAGDLAIFARSVAVQRITVDLVFIEPYATSPRNRIIPALEPWAAKLREDGAIKLAVARLRLAYLTKAQSLLHGDLHSGSVMATADDTKVIDGEFACVGPVGFDVGNFLAHLVIAWFAAPFRSGDAAEFRAKLEADMVSFWRGFRRRFLELSLPADGDGLPQRHFATGDRHRARILEAYVDDVLHDAVGYLAVELVRRIVGFAQVQDFLSLGDAQALPKARALSLARALLREPEAFRTPEALVAALPVHERAGLDP
jgi:5-methylthioribose kinase